MKTMNGIMKYKNSKFLLYLCYLMMMDFGWILLYSIIPCLENIW